MVRPAEIGFPTWRITQEVTFTEPGLYPMEVVYIEIAEHAALEMSYFVGEFTDFEMPSNQPPITKLNIAGFQLFAPTSFFQSVTGHQAFPDLATCQQCDRKWVNEAGQNGCASGYYCNEAALCALCETNQFCGPTCAPCGGTTPYCDNVNATPQCVGCRADTDCNGGTCNPDTKTCNAGAGGHGGSGGSGGSAGNGGSGGSAGNGNTPGDAGCSCRVLPSSSDMGIPAMIGLMLAGLRVTRTRRKRTRTS